MNAWTISVVHVYCCPVSSVRIKRCGARSYPPPPQFDLCPKFGGVVTPPPPHPPIFRNGPGNKFSPRKRFMKSNIDKSAGRFFKPTSLANVGSLTMYANVGSTNDCCLDVCIHEWFGGGGGVLWRKIGPGYNINLRNPDRGHVHVFHNRTIASSCLGRWSHNAMSSAMTMTQWCDSALAMAMVRWNDDTMTMVRYKALLYRTIVIV